MVHSVSQQAATCPGRPFLGTRGGASSTHSRMTRTLWPPVVICTVSSADAPEAHWRVSGQRGWKAQPVGGFEGDGTSPLRTMRCFLGRGLGSGTADSSDTV